MESICGVDCCSKCNKLEECGGCQKTQGHPFGGVCVAAECVKSGGFEAFFNMKNELIEEFNSLGIKNLHISDLNLINGFYVNLEYKLANGESVKLLQDNNIYWANQVEVPESDRCYGIVADDKYLVVSEYGCNGADPEIVVYKKIK